MIRGAFLFICVIALTAAITPPVNYKSLRYDFVAGSTLTIDGTSTVHDYSCSAKTLQGFMTSEADESGKLVKVTDTRVTVAVTNLDCGKSQMNDNLKKALKMKANPNITFTLESATLAAGDQNVRTTIKARGQLSVAGTTKPVDLTVTAVTRPDGKIELQGAIPLKMTTFDVKPPTMFLGTLKTSDDVKIEFKVIAAPALGT